MRFRLPRYSRRLLVVALLAAVGLLAVGGGVYAAFGGAGHTANNTTDIALNRGLVGYWPFTGNAKDATPFGNNGMLSGSPTLTTDRKGAANAAYAFNGSNFMRTTFNNVITGAAPRTMSLWFKSTTSSAGAKQYVMASFGGTMTAGTGSYLRFYSGSVGFDIVGCAADTSETPYIDGNWHNIIGTTNGTTSRTYIDGTLVSSSNCTPATTSGGLYIAAGNASNLFIGSLDDLRIYNRVINTSEITALYKSYNPNTKTDTGENGLVGWWKMDGNAKDSTPNGYNGTVTAATLTTDRKNAANTAYSFNGSSSNINMGNVDNLTTSNWSMSAWFKTSVTGTQQILISKYNSSSGTNPGYALGINSGNNLFYILGDGSATRLAVSGTGAAVTDGKWHLATVTFTRAGNGVLYVDGVSTNSNAISSQPGSATNTAPLYIGTGSGITQTFNGSIDDVRLYNRALSATEVKSLYASYNPSIELGGSGTTGSVSLGKGEVADYPFNGNAKDMTPYSDNGTVTGATLSTDRKNRANSSYSFNGSSNNISLPSGFANFPNGLSISVWANPTANNSYARFIDLATGSNVNNNIAFARNGTGNSLLFVVNLGSVATASSTAGTIVNNAWHNYTVTENTNASNNVMFYVDGVLVGYGTQPIPTNITRTSNYIAKSNYTADGLYAGQIDDVRMWNRPLNQAEVTALYQEYR